MIDAQRKTSPERRQKILEAARYLAGQPRVRLVDLTEFDPSLDVADATALTAGRWVCETLAGFVRRPR